MAVVTPAWAPLVSFSVLIGLLVAAARARVSGHGRRVAVGSRGDGPRAERRCRPLGLPAFYESFLYLVFSWIALATSWSLLSGYAGYFSFGHGAFFGAGMYTTATLTAAVQRCPSSGRCPPPGAVVGAAGAWASAPWSSGVPPAARRAVRAAHARHHVRARHHRAQYADRRRAGRVPERGAAAPAAWPRRRARCICWGSALALAARWRPPTPSRARGSGSGSSPSTTTRTSPRSRACPRSATSSWRSRSRRRIAGVAGGIHAVYVSYVTVGETFSITVPLYVVLMSILGGARHWLGPAVGAAHHHGLALRLHRRAAGGPGPRGGGARADPRDPAPARGRGRRPRARLGPGAARRGGPDDAVARAPAATARALRASRRGRRPAARSAPTRRRGGAGRCVLVCEDVWQAFGGIQALRGVSLQRGAGRDRRSGGPERLGQDDADQRRSAGTTGRPRPRSRSASAPLSGRPAHEIAAARRVPHVSDPAAVRATSARSTTWRWPRPSAPRAARRARRAPRRARWLDVHRARPTGDGAARRAEPARAQVPRAGARARRPAARHPARRGAVRPQPGEIASAIGLIRRDPRARRDHPLRGARDAGGARAVRPRGGAERGRGDRRRPPARGACAIRASSRSTSGTTPCCLRRATWRSPTATPPRCGTPRSQVDDGEVVSVIGPNGAGKSTLVNAIAGLHARARGRAAPRRRRPHRRAAAPRVPPGHRAGAGGAPAVHAHVGGGESRDGLLPRRGAPGAPARRWSACTRLFPILRERRRQLAGSLSGGQQQMVAIGRGAHGPARACCCSTSPRSAWRRRSSIRCSRSSARFTTRAWPSCSWSRTWPAGARDRRPRLRAGGGPGGGGRPAVNLAAAVAHPAGVSWRARRRRRQPLKGGRR